MIRCLIKHRPANNKAFTLTEMILAVSFSVILMTGVYGFYTTSAQFYSSGVSGQGLQDGSNIVLRKISEGESESGIVYRLSTSVAYMIPNGVGSALYSCGGSAQAAACNISNPSGEIYFCQDSPCTYGDSSARWYYLNSAGTSIIYHHPAAGGGTVEENIYTVPSASTLNLRFSPAQSGGQTLPYDVEIDVDLTGNTAGNVTNKRLMTSGDASTFVLLRSHP